MSYLRMSRRVPADQVNSVRKTLHETQTEFALRFGRSRYSIIRWENDGLKIKDNSDRARAWREALIDARNTT
ncbi:hypothetical protein LCGC14_0639740 [marine sediment metagenome]|uniref:HTH cro/C1-type domain-containing protein n=1 Tax=marine sediment metagenome TaxID=412755 RepID=A0A0F9R4Q1_9ZZZZ